jgi:NAD(P)H-dependent flavin oxidoreductase YrpB (nitropropane dioxygenase family)
LIDIGSDQQMPIRNRLTQILGIEHPILLAPMDLASGGRLAAAVSHAGGLGLLGGGYGDGGWIEREWTRAGNARSDAGSSPGVSQSILNCCIGHSSSTCRCHAVVW